MHDMNNYELNNQKLTKDINEYLLHITKVATRRFSNCSAEAISSLYLKMASYIDASNRPAVPMLLPLWNTFH